MTSVTLQGTGATIHGGGIYNNTGPSTHLYLKNVVIADSGAGGNCYDQTPDSASFSLSSDGTCPFIDMGNCTNTPALLGPLQDNGGGMLTLPTQTSPSAQQPTLFWPLVQH